MTRSARVLWIAALVAVTSSAATAGTLYATNDSNDYLYRVDPVTGSSTAVGPTGIDLMFTGLAYDSANGIMYVSDAYDFPVMGLGMVDLDTGAVTMVGSHVSTVNLHALAYDSAHGVLYGADTMPCGGLSIVDRGTGESTCVGPFLATPAIYGLAYDPTSDTLYGVDGTALYTIDRFTGAAALVGLHGMAGSSEIMGLEFDWETEVLYAVRENQLYTLDPASGEANPVGIGMAGNPNPGGLASVPVLLIFADGFEGGTTSMWH